MKNKYIKLNLDELKNESSKIYTEIQNREEKIEKKKLAPLKHIKYLVPLYVKKFTTETHHARTLNSIGKQPSGWNIFGEVHEDYFKWVNDFVASHENGKWWIKGNFENTVEASSKKAYIDFVKNHPYEEWDYYDI